MSRLRSVTYEMLDPEKTTLMSAPLPFLPGYTLVSAMLQPQIISHTRRKDWNLDRVHRSCFLYNPNVTAFSNQFIPLTPREDWIVHINKRLGLKINEQNAIAYLKYCAHVLWDDGLYFVTTGSDIPWKESCTEIDKAQAYGAIGADINLAGDNFVITVDRDHSCSMEDVFRFTIPAILEEMICRIDAKVSEKGYVDVNSGSEILGSKICDSKETAPYYQMDFKDCDYRVPNPLLARIARYGFRTFDLSVFSLSIIAQIIVLFATMIGSNSDQPFERLLIMTARQLYPNLPDLSVVFDVLFVGTTLSLGVEVAKSIREGILARAAARGPGKLSSEWSRWKEKLQKRYYFNISRYITIFTFFFKGVVLLAATWAFLLFWAQYKYYALFESAAFPTFHEAFVYTFTHLTLSFWAGTLYGPPFSDPTTFWGGFVPWLIGLSEVFLLVRVAERFWSLTLREKAR